MKPPSQIAAEAVEYPEPTPNDLNSPEFEAVWQSIKRWDISRHNNGKYSGPTGNDVMHILIPLRPIIQTAIEEALREQREEVNRTQRLIGLTKLSRAAAQQSKTDEDTKRLVEAAEWYLECGTSDAALALRQACDVIRKQDAAMKEQK